MTDWLSQNYKQLVPVFWALIFALHWTRKNRIQKTNQVAPTQINAPQEPKAQLAVTLCISDEYPDKPLIGASPSTGNRIQPLSNYSKETEEGRGKREESI
jgi:hypothetical protein